MGHMHEYVVIGRRVPTAKVPNPKITRMNIFAPSDIVARSKFWYFMKRLRNVKRMNGEILACSEVFEKRPVHVKNFGIWLRYDSRSGTHNMYKEYRELTRSDAVSACYLDMAARHRARYQSIQIIRVAVIVGKDKVRRASTKQFLNGGIKFPLPHRIPRASSAQHRSVFVATRPNTTY